MSRKQVATRKHLAPGLTRHKLDNSHSPTSGAPDSDGTTSSNEIVAGRSSRTDTQRRELDLLHHYCTSTHRSLGDAFQIPFPVWQTFVVQEAFKHDFLLNGIFAIAALHVANEKIAVRSGYDIIAAEYLEDALATFRGLLLRISVEKVRALFAFAILLCVNLFGQLQSTIAGMNWKTLLEKLDAIFECLDGVRKILVAGEDHLLNSPLGSILEQLSQEPSVCPDPDIRNQLQKLKELSQLETLHLPDSAAKKNFYDRIITELESCWVHEVLVIHWFAKAGKEFQTDLQKGEAMAKLLLAYWGTTLHALDRHWYAKGLGRVIVDMATKNLKTTSSEMEIMSNWTRQKVGLD